MSAPARSKSSRRPSPISDPAADWFARGNAHLRLGQTDDAIAAYDQALRLRPAFPEALRAGGGVLRDRGATEAALRFFGEAIRLQPTYLDAILDKGNLLQGLGRTEEALAVFDVALIALPQHAGLLCNQGAILHSLGRLPEALGALEAACAADPKLPQAHLNLAGVLMRLFRHAEALPILDHAIALQPYYSAAHANRGLALKMLGRFAEAASALDLAIEQDSTNAYALTNRGELRLLLGDYQGGLSDYQARLATEWQNTPLLRHFVPFWSGQSLPGLRIVAIADAGNGDVIHFARYVPLLVAAGAEVTVICRPRLQRLLSVATRGARVVDEVGDDEDFDCMIPFSNLPFVFATTVETIPGATPYLEAEPERIAAWHERLGGHGFKVGLCWRGNQDWRADPHRSIPIETFAPLAALPGLRLISLHADREVAAPSFALEAYGDVDTGPDGFIDTAAIIANLDLVVTIDTSIAHLAGALGRPTYLLLRKVPEWRWLIGRDDTPWYPSTRLFRQERAGEWTGPIQHLTESLQTEHASRFAASSLR